MVALSRLKATFEACPGLFFAKTSARVSRRSGMTKSRSRVRRTESLPKMSALQHEDRTAENARARITSVRVPYACRQSGLEAGRKQVFSGSDGTWAKAYGQARGYMWVMPFTGFSTTSTLHVDSCGYSASIRSRSLLDVPCHCSFTQPNTCIRSLAARAAGIPLSDMRTSSWIMDGVCQELPAYRARAAWESVSVKTDRMARKSSRVETEII